LGKRIRNIARYGVGDAARARKSADKLAKREATFESELWQREEGFAQRRYASYEAYLEHQVAKLDEIEDRLLETEAEDLAEFTRRFGLCERLRTCRSVLCLGARLGTEVQALLDLGHFAVGIDLNPGSGNAYVLKGDFHKLVFPEGSVDAVYTNTLDHVFDLGRVVGEVRRVLRPGGLFVADVLEGYGEGFTPGRYESTHWESKEALLAKVAELGQFGLIETRALGAHRRDVWTQAVFEKPL
jgi:SAM-dependent methyltransferase